MKDGDGGRRRAAPDPADARGGRARPGRGRRGSSRAPASSPSSAWCSSRSAPARCWCARCRRCSARSTCQGLVRDIADDLAENGDALALKERLESVCGTMACHGSVRAGRRLTAGRDERAAAPDGGDAPFRPVQPRPPDLCRAEARRHRAPVRPAVSWRVLRLLAPLALRMRNIPNAILFYPHPERSAAGACTPVPAQAPP